MGKSDPKGVVVIKVHRHNGETFEGFRKSDTNRAIYQRDEAIDQKVIPETPGYGIVVDDYEGAINLVRFTNKGIMRYPKDGFKGVRRFWNRDISADELTDRIMDTIGNDMHSITDGAIVLYSGPLSIEELGESFEQYISSPHFQPHFFRGNGKPLTRSQKNLLVATVDMTSSSQKSYL